MYEGGGRIPHADASFVSPALPVAAASVRGGGGPRGRPKRRRTGGVWRSDPPEPQGPTPARAPIPEDPMPTARTAARRALLVVLGALCFLAGGLVVPQFVSATV